MRTLQDSRSRWKSFHAKYKSIDSLKQDVLLRQHTNSPCEAGVRSLCWKLFLIFPDFSPTSWRTTLETSREKYTDLRQNLLSLIESGVIIPNDDSTVTTIDPLAEDPSNPWSQLRKDEELRREIIQDVERCMPDNPYFRLDTVQKHMLDILFVYCKLNPDIGYRQGMHELVAPILWTVHTDAIGATSVRDIYCSTEEDEEPEEALDMEEDVYIKEMLDPEYIEHDTFTLFQKMMEAAKPWYELGEGGGSASSPIVEKSRLIHETYLMAVDPELAYHLKALDVLPQVFLIRWVRLLFGREFPFDQLLVVWDCLFAEDPGFTLVDYICVAMLLRIRWNLLESDYSTALSLLLRYPSPSPPNLPATFVADAIYLRKNLTPAGGAHIISKYSNRPPQTFTHTLPSSPPSSPPALMNRSPKARRVGSSGGQQSQQPSRIRATSPLSAKFIQAQGGLDWLMNDVAKNVLDRGEKWGVNKAVREVMGEVKRNVEGLQQQQLYGSDVSRFAGPFGGSGGGGDREREIDLGREKGEHVTRVTMGGEKNHVLAEMLERSLQDLEKAFGGESLSGGSEESTAVIRSALDRIHHVKALLLDDSISLDETTLQPPPPPPPPPLKLVEPEDIPHPPPPPTSNTTATTLHENESKNNDLPPLPATQEFNKLNKPHLEPISLLTLPESAAHHNRRLSLPALPPSPLPQQHRPRTPVHTPTTPHIPSSPRSPSPPPPPPPPKMVPRKERSLRGAPTQASFVATSLGEGIGVGGGGGGGGGVASEGVGHKARSSLAQSEFAWMLGEDPLMVRNKDAFGVKSGDGIGGGGGGAVGDLFGSSGGGGFGRRLGSGESGGLFGE